MGIQPPGAAALVLAGGVVHLDPERAVFDAMVEGWRRQQSARFLGQKATIAPRLSLIRRFADFTGLYPWQWTPAEGEAFIDHLRSTTVKSMTTARSYEVQIGLFVEFLLDSRYGWALICEERFGQTPQPVFHEGNSVLHKVDYEGDPRRRPLSYDEIQALFDAADARPGKIVERGVKGALSAARDAVLLKTMYAYGLRRTETSKLDVVDFRRVPKAPMHGNYGSVMVRFGKASKGSPPKRRTVLLVKEMDWVVAALDDWLGDLRPRFGPGPHAAMWMTERVGRISARSINDAFVAVREDAGLDENLDPHCLRHSYVTHLLEFGYPSRFIQEQVGHAHASTTSIYSGVSPEYRNKLLEASLKGRLGGDWDVTI